MGLKDYMRRLERRASGGWESFELLDGTRYFYDAQETHKELFLHAYDVQLGQAEKWTEPPEIYRKMCEAKILLAS